MKQHKESKPVVHPAENAAIDKTESGPPRLYSPSKPHEVESGPARLQTSIPGRHQTAATPQFASIKPHVGAGIDTTETGPPRIERYRK